MARKEMPLMQGVYKVVRMGQGLFSSRESHKRRWLKFKSEHMAGNGTGTGERCSWCGQKICGEMPMRADDRSYHWGCLYYMDTARRSMQSKAQQPREGVYFLTRRIRNVKGRFA